MDIDIIENRPEDLEKPILINTYKTKINKSSITLDFGNFKKGDDDNKVDVVASITIKPDIFMDLIVKLFSTGIEYQEKYKRDIGFPDRKFFEEPQENEEENNKAEENASV